MQRIKLDSVDSTNLEAKRLLANGRIERSALITACEQQAGRGSRGRSWASPRDAGVYMTVVDIPATPVCASGIDPTLFTLTAGVGCTEILREQTGIDVRIKPINDLFVEGRKLGGILTEAIVEQGHIRALLTGVGINTKSAARPDAAEPVALQELMSAHALAHLNMETLAEALARSILEWNGLAWRGEIDALRRTWESHLIPGGHGDTAPPLR